MSLLLLFNSPAVVIPPTPTPVVGLPVFPDSVVLEAGLGGRFDDVLVNEAFVKGAWSLGQIASTTSRDMTDNGHHGTYMGSGFTRGITVPLPEGALGCDFDGNGYILVADHSDLSLAGGSIDVVALFKTTTFDGVLRAIVQKQVTNGSGDGYHLGLKDGDVRFELNVGSVNVFSFGRGPISDGLWHVVHGYYDPVTQEARIFIDGVQSGATVSTAATDPTVEVCDLRIGMFNDDTGGFIGTIAKVMVGREGDLTLGAALEVTRVWTDITEDWRVSVMPITAQYGMSGSGVQDTVARAGNLTLALDNSEKNSAGLKGYYSVGHANCRSGFKVKAPIRLGITYNGITYYKFRGTIKAAPAIPGPLGERYVALTCRDWMDVPARTSASGLPVQVDEFADTVAGIVVDGARRPPPAVEMNPSVIRFPYAIDSGQGDTDKLMSELTKIGVSTGASIFQKGDTDQGGTFVFLPRETRQAAPVIAYTFSELRDLAVEYDDDRIKNIINATYYPRRLDTVTDAVLATVAVDETAQPVQPGQTITLTAGYKDPAQKSSRIGGTGMVSESGTDYTMNAASNGTGDDLTADFDVTVNGWANEVEWEITNNGTQTGFITLLQARGQAIYHDDSVKITEESAESVRQHDECELNIDLPYEGSVSNAREYARLIRDTYSTLPAIIPRTATIIGNRSAALLEQALLREVGDCIGLEELQTGITTTDGWYIQQVTLTISAVRGGVLVQAAWDVAPAWPESMIVAYAGAASGLHNMTFGGALELSTPGDYTFAFNRLGDTINVRGAAAGGGGAAGIGDSTNSRGGGAGGGGESLDDAGIDVLIDVADYTGKVGAGGIGTTRPGGTGGTTEFRKASELILQLIGGTGGVCTAGGTVTGGAGGTGGTGTGRTAGSTGGAGSVAGGGGNDGVDGDTGGGGGGGAASGQGGIGGDGEDQAGGARGAAGNSGTDASGKAGTTNGGSAPGGGGGGGGGKDFGNLGFRGGGGGGGSGGTSTNGDGGKGSDGALVLELV